MRLKQLAAALAVSGLALSALSGSPAYAGAGADRAARVDSSSKAATAALSKVESLFAKKPAGTARSAATGARPDATLALRDLRFRMDALSSADQARAKHFFARPSDGDTGETGFWNNAEAANSPLCGIVCVHWTIADLENAPPVGDVSGIIGVPDQVEATKAVAEQVYGRIVTTGGYRAPQSDLNSPNNGDDARLDIYLSNLGDNALFGYCTSDDPDQSFEISAFCVVDDDFVDFPPTAPLDAMKVTVAHEFFHAVQFNYEAAEDNWFMESTATWIEDEIYDDINDNLNYISSGNPTNPITHPGVPLDLFANNWPNYGSWVFWKKLTETYKAQNGHGLPDIVREVWTKAANHQAKGASTMALSKVLASHHTSFGKVFTAWGVGNRFPKKSYSEGKSNHYPSAPINKGGKLKLTNAKRNINWLELKLFHMANGYARFTPKSLPGKWKLHVTVNLPDKVTGSHATLTIYKKSGRISKVPISINKRGAGGKTVLFGNGKVKYVELTLTNASNRFKNCYPLNGYSPYTCGGKPKDDRLPYRFKASVSR